MPSALHLCRSPSTSLAATVTDSSRLGRKLCPMPLCLPPPGTLEANMGALTRGPLLVQGQLCSPWEHKAARARWPGTRPAGCRGKPEEWRLEGCIELCKVVGYQQAPALGGSVGHLRGILWHAGALLCTSDEGRKKEMQGSWPKGLLQLALCPVVPKSGQHYVFALHVPAPSSVSQDAPATAAAASACGQHAAPLQKARIVTRPWCSR